VYVQMAAEGRKQEWLNNHSVKIDREDALEMASRIRAKNLTRV